MNLTKLFEMQRQLDERIVKEKGLEGQDLLSDKILALQVELGKCANEWRGFKYWSKDQQPRLEKWTIPPGKDADWATFTNPLLEEYIDCLHFILSIGLENDMYQYIGGIEATVCDTITQSFNRVFLCVADVAEDFDVYEFQTLIEYFLGLGQMLDFSWSDILEAYKTKWEINHQRQSNGY